MDKVSNLIGIMSYINQLSILKYVFDRYVPKKDINWTMKDPSKKLTISNGFFILQETKQDHEAIKNKFSI